MLKWPVLSRYQDGWPVIGAIQAHLKVTACKYRVEMAEEVAQKPSEEARAKVQVIEQLAQVSGGTERRKTRHRGGVQVGFHVELSQYLILQKLLQY